uniref:Uncharacterized protein n=1 Tax=Cyprinus carpio TaxID=7962 RepID=A0A8C1Z645_CYPCA
SRSLHALHSGTEVLYRLAQHCEAASLSALLTSEAHWDRPLGWRVFWCQKGKVPLRASVREKGQAVPACCAFSVLAAAGALWFPGTSLLSSELEN